MIRRILLLSSLVVSICTIAYAAPNSTIAIPKDSLALYRAQWSRSFSTPLGKPLYMTTKAGDTLATFSHRWTSGDRAAIHYMRSWGYAWPVFVSRDSLLAVEGTP